MSNTTNISELYGVDVSDFNVVQLTKESFRGINLDLYPPEHAHLLVYALQFQLKPPSPQTIRKTQKRNKRKILGLTPTVKVKSKKAQKKSKKLLKPRRGARRVSSSSYSQSQSLSLAAQNKKNSLPQKFVVRSPEQIVLKSARKQCLEMLQSKWRSELTNQMMVNESKPIYFIKKKANQKRRRQEKNSLIKKHKEKLLQIFGDDILSKMSRISRKDIKIALGINDFEVSLDGLREFNQMVEQRKMSLMIEDVGRNDEDEDIERKTYKLQKKE